jgi:hypothetical protein
MKLSLSKEQVMGVVRHTLTFVGGILLMKGLVDEATWTELSGGLATLVGAVWSIVDKSK